jgi:hypothetical protein
MRPIMVAAELAREGIEWSALDYWTGYWGTGVERFVGRTEADLARFLWWAEYAGATVNADEARSEEGRQETMLGFQAAAPIEYASIEAAA